MKNKIFLFGFYAALFVILSMTLGGCSSAGKTVTGQSQNDDLAYAEPITDNLLAGLNANDYSVFSKDFDEKMKKGLSQDVFTQTYEMIHEKIGKYVSRSVTSVSESDNLITVVYSAKFEKEEGVTIRVIVEKNSDLPLAGLWMDSPSLRQ
jgi:hypothetical protein